MSSKTLAAECVGGPHDGTLAVIQGPEGEEFPVRISLAWNGGTVIYRRRHRPMSYGHLIYYEFLEELE